MLVALHRGRGVIARAIQWQTRSVYSHASVVFEGSGVVIEAREFKGVRSILWDEVVASGETVDVFRVKGLVPEAEEVVWEFLQEQLGKPYDYTMVARFITRRQGAREESGKWFCSELVFAALAQAGVRLLERIEAWEVSPGVLRLSTRLEEAGEKPRPRQDRGENTQNARTGKNGEQKRNVQRPTLNFQCSEEGATHQGASGKAEASLRTPKGEQAGTPAVRQAGGLRYEEGNAGEGACTTTADGGVCPTTEEQVHRLRNNQWTMADSQGGGL